MKNLFKSVIFIAIFIFLYYGFSYLLLPKENIKEFGLIKTSEYEILGEAKNSVDAIIVGDSLVYSSVIPMEIYGKYGYTVFDCAEAAFILPDAYDYYKVAMESQKPKVAILGGNMFFRNTRKRKWYVKYERALKKAMPLLNYHNNWKNVLFSDYGIMSIQKGYKLNKTIKSGQFLDYMKENDKEYVMIESNLEYLKKFVDLAKEYNTKLIIIGFPSQNSWNHQRDKKFNELSKELGFTFINLNKYDLNINWETDTKDEGGHLNYFGALKASNVIGNILKETNLLVDHRGDKNYKLWDTAYLRYKEEVNK